eukprot:7336113-Pyramimonas_sp.AAC.1
MRLTLFLACAFRRWLLTRWQLSCLLPRGSGAVSAAPRTAVAKMRLLNSVSTVHVQVRPAVDSDGWIRNYLALCPRRPD